MRSERKGERLSLIAAVANTTVSYDSGVLIMMRLPQKISDTVFCRSTYRGHFYGTGRKNAVPYCALPTAYGLLGTVLLESTEL
jgi:hypothetical protein